MWSKLLPLFVYPLGLAILLNLMGGVAAAFKHRRLAIGLVGAALVVLWTCSTPLVARWAMASLERQYPARSIAETPEADVAVVVGGAVGQPLPPRVEVEPSNNRVLHAARLFRAGKVKRILVTAGALPWLPAIKPEADDIKELLVEWGVPDEAIEVGGASRDTHENAVEVQVMWRKSNFRSALLVTSAAHMPRALAAFRNAGVPVVASSTDVQVAGELPLLFSFVPDVSALGMSTFAIKEWLGHLVYRARGFL